MILILRFNQVGQSVISSVFVENTCNFTKLLCLGEIMPERKTNPLNKHQSTRTKSLLVSNLYKLQFLGVYLKSQCRNKWPGLAL